MVGPTQYHRFNWDRTRGFFALVIAFVSRCLASFHREGHSSLNGKSTSLLAAEQRGTTNKVINEMTETVSSSASNSGDWTLSSDLAARFTSSCGRVEIDSREANDKNASSSMNKGKARVNFGTITAWEFPPTIGDNPSVSAGVPISLGHSPSSTVVVDIDAYEKSRKPRRTTRQLKIDCRAREEMYVLAASFRKSLPHGNAEYMICFRTELMLLRLCSTGCSLLAST
jgi:hypothetical protein